MCPCAKGTHTSHLVASPLLVDAFGERSVHTGCPLRANTGRAFTTVLAIDECPVGDHRPVGQQGNTAVLLNLLKSDVRVELYWAVDDKAAKRLFLAARDREKAVMLAPLKVV